MHPALSRARALIIVTDGNVLGKARPSGISKGSTEYKRIVVKIPEKYYESANTARFEAIPWTGTALRLYNPCSRIELIAFFSLAFM